jgi:predicted component of type VI protein secretion system
MYLLKLFHEADAVQPISAHMVANEITQVGRDPSSHWVIPDADCEVSRNHLELILRDGSLLLRPLGANGVYAFESEERLPTGEDIPLALGDTFRFGKYKVTVGSVPFDSKASHAGNRTMVLAAPFGEAAAIPTEWSDAPEPPPLSGDGSLLEAFCEGAKLDASAFSGEDPCDVMRRAGAVYRQMVLGLGDLMSERSSTKTQYRMDRTTIGAQDNNPFKWAPTQRLAIDLLLRRDSGFLSGAAAIKASFEDVKKHLLCTLAGFRASLAAVLDLGNPRRIEEQAESQSMFLKSRAAICWSEYEAVHRKLQEQALQDQDGPLNQAFIQAYEDKMRDLHTGTGH